MKRLYKPPTARDLSGSSASGMIPMGFCADGTEPAINTCTDGFIPKQDQAHCAPTGLTATYAGCAGGTNVISVCEIGSIVQPS